MKKILVILLGVIGLLMPSVVYANGLAAPKSYEVIVNKDNAVYYYYDYDKEMTVEETLPKGTELTIWDELYKDGIWYGRFRSNIVDDYGTIKLEDVMLKNAVFDLEEACKNESEEKEEIYVFGDNVYLYNGPSRFYSKVSNNAIPIGTTLTVEYTDCSETTSSFNRYWVYASYGNLKGWVQVGAYIDSEEESPNVAFVEKNKIYIFEDITTLYEKPDYTSKKINVNISKYTEVDYLYKYDDQNCNVDYIDGYIYIKYGDIEGWLYVGGYGSENEAFNEFFKKGNFKSIITSEDGLELYTKYNDNNSKTNIKIPLNTEFDVYYVYDSWVYLSYQGKYYWANSEMFTGRDPGEGGFLWSFDGKISVGSYEGDNNYITAIKTNVYSSPTIDAKVIDTLEPFTEITPKYVKSMNSKEYINWSKDVDTDSLNYDDYITWFYLSDLNGWVKEDDLGWGSGGYYENVTRSLDIYQTIDEKTNNMINIPKNTIIHKKFSYTDKNDKTWYYIESNAGNGWLSSSNYKYLASVINETRKIKSNYNNTLLETLDIIIYSWEHGHCCANEKQTEEFYNLVPVSAGSEVTALRKYTHYYYSNDKLQDITILLVDYNGQQGWIRESAAEFIKSNEITETLPDTKEDNTEETELPSIDTSDKKVSVFNKMSSELVISLCIFIALCLSIVALIIIVKVNEKKKKKEVDGEEKQ